MNSSDFRNLHYLVFLIELYFSRGLLCQRRMGSSPLHTHFYRMTHVCPSPISLEWPCLEPWSSDPQSWDISCPLCVLFILDNFPCFLKSKIKTVSLAIKNFFFPKHLFSGLSVNESEPCGSCSSFRMCCCNKKSVHESAFWFLKIWKIFFRNSLTVPTVVCSSVPAITHIKRKSWNQTTLGHG